MLIWINNILSIINNSKTEMLIKQTDSHVIYYLQEINVLESTLKARVPAGAAAKLIKAKMLCLFMLFVCARFL